MKIEITAKGIYGAGGEIAVGTVLEVKEEPKGWEGRYRKVTDSQDGKEPLTNPATFTAPYSAKDKGGGWWAIYDADGKEVKNLRKDDAEIFNALSDEDKAAHVAGLKAE